jgi:hypothetical protein
MLPDIPESIAFVGVSEASSTCISDRHSAKMKNTEHWWNDTERGKLKCPQKTLSRCHFSIE